MKIATYNIWNEKKVNRSEQIVNEIDKINTDIIGLQEVTPSVYTNFLARQDKYPYHIFAQYSSEDEGLAILSKFPIIEHIFLNGSKEYAFCNALNVLFEFDGYCFSLTNVHLPWDSIKAREEQIISIDKYIHTQMKKVDFSILLGDFNGNMSSSDHRFLVGDQTLNGAEAKPSWYELSSIFAELNNLPVKPTLDFNSNPRWRGKKNTSYIPCAVDRIYLKGDVWAEINGDLKNCEIFGTNISSINNFSASDHYGVVVEFNFKK